MNTQRLVKAYIVDDDLQARTLLERLLSSYSIEIVGSTADLQEAEKDMTEQKIDLLFLDVEMPAMTGLDFYKKIQPEASSSMKVVFYTGYDKYMIDALRHHAFDYMLKPATPAELATIMTRYYEQKISSLQSMMLHHDTQQPPQVIIVTPTGEHMMLDASQIAFFRYNTERRLWEVLSTDGRCNLLRHRTTADVILNYSKNFVQIHKRYIVNVRKIHKIVDNQCLLVAPLEEVRELRISKNYRSDFMNSFYNM